MQKKSSIKKKKIIPPTNERNKSYEKKKYVIYAKKDLAMMKIKKKYRNVRDHCHYTEKYREATHSICNLRYKTRKEIPVVFHNGSTYDYYFINKEVPKECEDKSECSGENTEKYITF